MHVKYILTIHPSYYRYVYTLYRYVYTLYRCVHVCVHTDMYMCVSIQICTCVCVHIDMLMCALLAGGMHVPTGARNAYSLTDGPVAQVSTEVYLAADSKG